MNENEMCILSVYRHITLTVTFENFKIEYIEF